VVAKRAPAKKDEVAPYSRLHSFESREHMDRHDAEIMAIMERYEEHRHRSEVRTLIRIRVDLGSWKSVQAYLALARKKRGELSANRLADDVKAQWLAGNRGIKGDWRTG
jgi:hypothetical protein